MLTQKLYKNGNSVAVTIPKEYLRELGLKEGSQVVVEVSPYDAAVVVTKASKKKAELSALTPEFKSWLDRVSKEHSQLIKKLAKK